MFTCLLFTRKEVGAGVEVEALHWSLAGGRGVGHFSSTGMDSVIAQGKRVVWWHVDQACEVL